MSNIHILSSEEWTKCNRENRKPPAFFFWFLTQKHLPLSLYWFEMYTSDIIYWLSSVEYKHLHSLAAFSFIAPSLLLVYKHNKVYDIHMSIYVMLAICAMSYAANLNVFLHCDQWITFISPFILCIKRSILYSASYLKIIIYDSVPTFLFFFKHYLEWSDLNLSVQVPKYRAILFLLCHPQWFSFFLDPYRMSCLLSIFHYPLLKSYSMQLGK